MANTACMFSTTVKNHPRGAGYCARSPTPPHDDREKAMQSKHTRQDGGEFYGTAGLYDLYLCETWTGQSLVARFGDHPADYESCPMNLFRQFLEPTAVLGTEKGAVNFPEWMESKEAPEFYRGWKEIATGKRGAIK